MPVLTEEEIAVLKLVMVDPVKPSDALLGVARCLLDTLDAKDERIKELEEALRETDKVMNCNGLKSCESLAFVHGLQYSPTETALIIRAKKLRDKVLGEQS